jgi:uncharacterized membrane protein YozB (DUF420 family)
MNGFLPTRGSLMLDFVTVAMVAVSLLLLLSVYWAKRQWRWHRALQITLAVILLVAIVAFEVDLRFFSDWQKLAEPSPYYESGWVHRWLWVHLGFAVPTPFLWAGLIFVSLKGQPQNPAEHVQFANWHKRWGWASVILMWLTAVTGWVFYWVSFVAT